ncbi:MAG: hypothetical protein NUV98_00905 [Candidatus Roizmanbacteria bacterium]|nr:hypothetical protein [Candidatus Roizmanbacteria bacterium]
MITQKQGNVKIIQISSIQKQGDGVITIYGLGDDEKVYWWSASDHVWNLWG